MAKIKKIRQHQELERWKCKATTVHAGLQVSRVRAISCDPRDTDRITFELLIENFTGSWRLKKSLLSFKVLCSHLRISFPVEAGLKGHQMLLPHEPGRSKLLLLLSSQEKRQKLMMEAANEYCSLLLNLPPYISRSFIVLDFFFPKQIIQTRVTTIDGEMQEDDGQQSVSGQFSSVLGVSDSKHSSMENNDEEIVFCMGEKSILIEKRYLDNIQDLFVGLKEYFLVYQEYIRLEYSDGDGDTISLIDDEDLFVARLFRSVVVICK